MFKRSLKFKANLIQESIIFKYIQSIIFKYIQSFVNRDIDIYKESLKEWVKDFQPSVEHIFGFVEPYRDPFGIRAEFEGLVGIMNKAETETLSALVENSTNFIRRLPWAENQIDNDGKGPFEKALFEKPDFTSLYSKSTIHSSKTEVNQLQFLYTVQASSFLKLTC